MESKENNVINDVFAVTEALTLEDLTEIGKVVVQCKAHSNGNNNEVITTHFQKIEKYLIKCRELYAYHISDFLFTLQLCEEYKVIQKEKRFNNKFANLESMKKRFCVLISFAAALNVSKINNNNSNQKIWFQ